MLKGLGLLLVVICCGGYGSYAAAREREKHQLLIHLAALLHELEIEMWCTGDTLQHIFSRLAERETYAGLGFLKAAAAALAEHETLEAAWKTAVEQERFLSAEGKGALQELGGELGRSDMHSQREILCRYRERLEEMAVQEQTSVQKKAKLYQSLGILTGLAVALLLS